MAVATKEKSNFMTYVLIAIPGILALGYIVFNWLKTKNMLKSLEGLSLKNESKIRTQRNLYKQTLESAILKAADRIKAKEKVSEKNEEITAYKEEKKDNDVIESYKKE